MTRSRSAALLFIGVYFGNAIMPVSLQGDSRWNIRTALSMIHSRTADLRAFAPAVEKSGFYLTECVGPNFRRQFPLNSIEQCEGGRLYAFNPIAVPMLAAPFVMAYEAATHLMSPILGPLADRLSSPVQRAFFKGDAAGSTTILEILISSFFTAASVTVLYLAVLELHPSWALLIALTFAFGTLLWSLVSRALWQHSPSVFLNSLVVLILIRAERAPQPYGRRVCFALGFILALAFFVRPTNAVTVLVIGTYLLVRLRAKVVWLIPGGLIPTLCFVLIDWEMYRSVLAPYFLPVRTNATGLSLHAELGLALISNLFSPARGLFVFMPFFLLLLVPAVWKEPMPDAFRRLRPWFCALIALHMLLIAMHTDWWGGFSYGPRYLTDILPYLMILWLPALPWASQARVRQAALAVTLAVSFLIQFRGATFIQVHEWNSSPISVNENTHRIWDWSDPPFLRGLRRTPR